MSEANQTSVGKTVTIKGEIIGNEPLTVEGRVEGKIDLESTIHVKESGFVKAEISCESITVAGGISGNIDASDKVEILKGGFMVGDIKSPRVVINDGANLKGQVEMEIDEDQLVARQQSVGSSNSHSSHHQLDDIHTSTSEAVEAVTSSDENGLVQTNSIFGRK